jgi:hypothetical protein
MPLFDEFGVPQLLLTAGVIVGGGIAVKFLLRYHSFVRQTKVLLESKSCTPMLYLVMCILYIEGALTLLRYLSAFLIHSLTNQ